MKRILLLALCWIFCLQACSASAPVQYKIKVVAEYNHDTSAYTQGLFFDGGTLYESTGQCGESSFRVVDYKSGKVLRKLDFARKYFGEGSVFFKGKLYMLTWTNKVAFTYDAGSLKYIKTYSYPREGWGLTTDGNLLIMSDGSAQLYFVSPKTFTIVRSVTVRSGGKSVNFLNELEYIEGKIWANVYLKDEILIIDPATGEVEGVVDCRGLLPKERRTRRTDVLNGIAWNPATGEIFITGKYWPAMYRIELEKKK